MCVMEVSFKRCSRTVLFHMPRISTAVKQAGLAFNVFFHSVFFAWKTTGGFNADSKCLSFCCHAELYHIKTENDK